MTMASLTTLGTIDLRNPAGDVAGSVLRQPRRFALLVYLALESRRGFVRRDRILGVFWPEVAGDLGRRSLSQALHYIRRALGDDCLESRGQEDVRLDLTRVRVDACAFLDCAEAGRHEEALRLLTGEFLPGFFPNEVPGFEQWQEATRSMLHRVAAESGWAAAEQAAERGEWVAAGSHARRAAAECGESEAEVRRLMGFLASLGDRGGALEAYEAFTRTLAREYEAEPADATRQLAAEIRDGVYATSLPQSPSPLLLLAAAPSPEPAVAVVPGESAAVVAEPASPEEAAGWHGSVRRQLLRVRSLAVSGVLMAAFISLWGLTREDGLPEVDHARLVVEPTVNAELGRSLSDAIMHQLTDAQPIEVIAAGEGALTEVPGTVDYALRTSLLRGAAGLQATVSVLERETGKVVRTFVVEDSAASSTAVLASLSRQIASLARQTVGEDLERRRAERAGVSEQVLAEFLDARGDVIAADSLMDRGMRAVARIRLASADSQLEALERAEPRWSLVPRERAELAYRAMWVQLLPPEGSIARARAVMAQGVWLADRAVRLDERDGRALELRGVLSYWLWNTAPQDSIRMLATMLQKAKADLETATQLNSASGQAWSILSTIRFQEGEFEKSYIAARNALEADAFMEDARAIRSRLFQAALEVGDREDAQRWCSSMVETDTDSWLGAYCQLTLLAWQPTVDAATFQRAEALRAGALASADGRANALALEGPWGVVLARAGRRAQAAAVADSLLQLGATQAEALPQAAWVMSVLGDTSNARAVLDRYILASPPARAWTRMSGRYTALRRAS